MGNGTLKKNRRTVKVWLGFSACEFEKSGQQTPRRWGWGTPLKKRAATRIAPMWRFGHFLSTPYQAIRRIEHLGFTRRGFGLNWSGYARVGSG
jgi:hypothetical protein